jgi:hypothetical protein
MGRMDLLFSLRRQVDVAIEQFGFWNEMASRRPSFRSVETKALEDAVEACMAYWDAHSVSA